MDSQNCKSCEYSVDVHGETKCCTHNGKCIWNQNIKSAERVKTHQEKTLDAILSTLIKIDGRISKLTANSGEAVKKNG